MILMYKRTILFFLIWIAIAIFSDDFTKRDGTVIPNVKATIKMKTVLIEHEDGRKEEISKKESKSLKLKSVVWAPKNIEEKKEEVKLVEKREEPKVEEKIEEVKVVEKGEVKKVIVPEEKTERKPTKRRASGCTIIKESEK